MLSMLKAGVERDRGREFGWVAYHVRLLRFPLMTLADVEVVSVDCPQKCELVW